jgi:hypothetical protein
MFRYKTIFAFFVMIFGFAITPRALANTELISFKTNVPLELPGRVIGPGRYYVTRLGSVDDHRAVEITNSKGIGVGVFMTDPVEHLDPARHTYLKLQKQADAPPRVNYFMQVGSDYGYKFDYPNAAKLPAQIATKPHSKNVG